jgi:hypothetical protein
MASNTTEVEMPHGTNIKVHSIPKDVDDTAEFVQISLADCVNLDAEEKNSRPVLYHQKATSVVQEDGPNIHRLG